MSESDATAAPSEPEDHRVTVEEAIRIKHRLGEEITWGNSGLNALHVEELTKISKEQWQEIRKDYRKWNVSIASNYVLLGIFVAGIVAWFKTSGWLHVLIFAVGCVYMYTLIKRDGHAEGYVDGYEAGHEAGVYKVLSIRNEEIGEMAKMATDMKIDNMLVERMDERKAQEKGNSDAQA